MRCAKCSHKWKQLPPRLENPEGTPAELSFVAEPIAAPQPTPEMAQPSTEPPISDAAPNIAAAPPRPRPPQIPTGPITVPPKLRPMMPKRRTAIRPAYIVLAGMLIGLGAVFYFRAEISRAVPALDMVYSVMGISTSSPAEDLETANLIFNRRNEDGKSVYSVQADVFNKSEYPVNLPIFVIKALDAERKQVGDAYPFRLEQENIEPGETITFRTFLDSLPKGTKTLRIEFSADE